MAYMGQFVKFNYDFSQTVPDTDEDMIYYMQTRGIDIKDGKQLILKGFSDEIINNINIDAIQLFLKNKIEKYLTNVYQF